MNFFGLVAFSGAVLGATILGSNAYSYFGIWGAAVGVPVGLVLGYLVFSVIGRVTGMLVLLILAIPGTVWWGVEQVLRRGADGPGPHEDGE